VVILTANLVVPIRLGALAAVFSPDLLPRLLPPLGGGLLAGLLVVAAAWYHLGKAEQQPDLVLRNPTEIPTALSFGLAYGAVLLLSAWLADIAGSSGLYAMALIAGLTDVDAITLSSLRLYGLGKLTIDQASNTVLIALCANLAFKLGIVFVVAGRHLGAFIAAGFAAIAIGTASLWIFL